MALGVGHSVPRRNDRLALVGVAIGVATLVVGIIALFR